MSGSTRPGDVRYVLFGDRGCVLGTVMAGSAHEALTRRPDAANAWSITGNQEESIYQAGRADERADCDEEIRGLRQRIAELEGQLFAAVPGIICRSASLIEVDRVDSGIIRRLPVNAGTLEILPDDDGFNRDHED